MAASHTVIWQQAVVTQNRPLTESARHLVLRPAVPARVEPGSHVDVRFMLAGQPVSRSYSLVDAAPDGSWFSVSVFRSPTSRGGAAVLHALAPGDRVEVTQPMQDFPLRIGAHSVVLLAGGIGITAIAGMARALKAVGADYRLVYCGRTRAGMAHLADLVAEHGDRLELHVGDEGTTLRVADLVGGLDSSGELYMCGPIRLMDEVRRAWVERALPLPRLRFETFGNSGWYDALPFTVRVPALGVETVVPTGSTLLEALEAAGIDALSDCRKGECGICEARVLGLSGVIDHRDVFYSERQRDAASKVCVCVSRVWSRDDETPSGASIDLALS